MTLSRFFYGGVFTASAGLMALQILQVRIFSATTWQHLAFLTISIAMFGLTVAAIKVYRGDAEEQRKNYAALMAKAADDMGFCVIIALMAQLYAPILNDSIQGALATLPLMAFFTALPYYKAGTILTLALTRAPWPVARTYGVNLAGAAAGCLAALGLIQFVDAPSAVLILATAVFGAALLFARADPETPFKGTARTMIVIVAIAVAVNVLGSGPFIYPHWIKAHPVQYRTVTVDRWNAISRVTIPHEIKGGKPFLWGPSPLLPEEARSSYYMLTIDGDTGTPLNRYDGIPENLDFLSYDVTTVAYALPGLQKVGVIGVGGGRDVLTAHVAGAQDITALDVNAVQIDLLVHEEPFKTYTGITALPGVRLIHSEARSWFSRHAAQFDLVQMGLIDSWAATGAGAFALTENGLYTAEAWTTFLDNLAPDGVFTVSRWYAPDAPNELERLLSLATRALLDSGTADPQRHVFIATGGRIATLVLSRSPFTPERIAALEARAKERAFGILVTPSHPSAIETFNRILAARTPAALDALAADNPLDIAPPTDNRPFFFNQVRLFHPVQAIRLALDNSGQAVPGSAKAAVNIYIVLVFAMLVTGLIVLWPLRGALAEAPGVYVTSGTAWFALIGLGFMLIEVALLQRLSLYLGHPAYGLGVALFSLVLFTGLGSLLSDKMPLANARRRALWIAATAAMACGLAVLPGPLFTAFAQAPLFGRAALCVALIAPAGILLGFGFPTGMALVRTIDEKPAPWFWGVNGAAGVTGSALAVALDIALGLNWTIILGGLCYALLILPSAGFSGCRKRV